MSAHDLVFADVNKAWWKRRITRPRRPFAANDFASFETYHDACLDLVRSMRDTAAADEVLTINGPVPVGFDERDAGSIAAVACAETNLHADAREILATIDRCDLVFFVVTAPADVATAAIVANVMRASWEGVSVGIIDHGYENFSLRRHLARHAPSPLLACFDFIVAEKDERDRIALELIEAVAGGHRPRGVLRLDQNAPAPAPAPVRESLVLDAGFASEHVHWLRLSPRRCYYDRCVFCVQNVKFASDERLRASEAHAAVDILRRFVMSGVRRFIFYDEALSPAFLTTFCARLIEQRMTISWVARCKIERAFTDELVDLMYRAGCAEILFGLESLSPRVLDRMDKRTLGVDADATAEICSRFHRRGIGLHLNFVVGFPGESEEDWETTIRWFLTHAPAWAGVTYLWNPFGVFADTIVHRAPERFGIDLGEPESALSLEVPFHYRGDVERRIVHALPRVEAVCDAFMGWSEAASCEAHALAKHLYFTSGHGAIFKSRRDNPMAYGYSPRASLVS